MTMNPLPPQAYTKDTLLKAYQWLMVQNSSIKEMATTPDILVSLYLKATRDGDSALERPSIQNFKNELKSLAGIMGELDNRPQQQAPIVSAPVHHHHVAPAAAAVHQATPVTAVVAPSAPTQTQVSYTEKTVTATTRNPDVSELLDSCSQDMIREVKEEFNLSSDLEALRMLIKIGYSRSKGLLK
ncbi:hypothetical protein [uncultured Bdellovibrio sp.]|uniref:hypothetical protein n=1 Tax=Bdellovibrio sp. HCB-162 TaxID=3394234 RepID=UPI0025D12F64|nr:hypothetical protein [uncultured Bdellovibrio sp.]